MRPIALLYWAMTGALVVYLLATVKLESLVTYLIIGVVLALVFSWLTGRSLSPRSWRRQPNLWDVLALAFAVSIPFIAQVIGDGFLSGVVVVLIALVLGLAWYRFGRPRAGVAPSDVRQPS